MYKKDVIYVSVDGALEGAFVNAIEDTNVGWSDGTPKGVLWDLYKGAQEDIFEFEIKGALKVKIELYLKMRMVVHLLSGTGVHKTIQ